MMSKPESRQHYEQQQQLQQLQQKVQKMLPPRPGSRRSSNNKESAGAMDVSDSTSVVSSKSSQQEKPASNTSATSRNTQRKTAMSHGTSTTTTTAATASTTTTTSTAMTTVAKSFAPPPTPARRPAQNSKNTTKIHGLCVRVADRYEKIGRIGQGTYGVVYKARDRETNRFVALKRCIPHNQESDGFPVTTLREIESLKLCSQHPNIVHLETIAVSNSSQDGGTTTGGPVPGNVFLVFEYCEHDLSQLIDAHYRLHRRSPFSQAAVKTLLFQLLDALDFLHRRNILHRDVKVANLLYTQNGMLKLADFGLSRPCSPSPQSMALPLTPNVASLWYRAPELLFGMEDYSFPVDIWAAGCVFAELLRGIPLMDGADEMDQLKKLFACMGMPRLHDWPQLSQCRFYSTLLRTLRESNDPAFLAATAISPTSSASQPPGQGLLEFFGDDLTDDGLNLLMALLRYPPYRRWTARKALVSDYFTEEPLPLDIDEMPRFSASFASSFKRGAG